MNNLCCPTCNVALMEHEACSCLNRWITALLRPAEPGGYDWCTHIEDAFFLMGKVWEMDARAAILKETIFIQVAGNKAPQHMPIDGSTFPLRVCRAFLFLKAKESAT